MKTYRQLINEIASFDPNHPHVKKALAHIAKHKSAEEAKKSLTSGSPTGNDVHSFYPNEADTLINHFKSNGGKFQG